MLHRDETGTVEAAALALHDGGGNRILALGVLGTIFIAAEVPDLVKLKGIDTVRQGKGRHQQRFDQAALVEQFTAIVTA